MKKNYFLLLLCFAYMGFSQSPGDIIITEIMINPTVVTDANGEWFEVYNTTASAIDMNGWIISDLGTNSHTIGASLSVPAGGYAVLARTAAATNGGATADYIITSGFGVSNGDDEIILQLPDLTVIDQVNYDGGPLFPDPTGPSIVLDPSKFNATDNDIGANWCESTTPFGAGDLGTPGAANDNCSTLSIESQEQIKFSMYPNPTNTGKVTISSRASEAITVLGFDVLGKQVINTILTNNTLDVSNIKAGVYILKIMQNNTSITKKLVIK